MVDELTPQQPVVAPEDPQLPPSGKKPGFLSTTRGKVVVILGAIFALMAVLGLAAVAFFVLFVGDKVDDVAQQISTAVTTSTVPAATATPAAQATTGQAEPPETVPLGEVFTFRDIFDPLLKEESEGGSDGGGGSSAQPDLEQNTLYLQEIRSADGQPVAVLVYNGKTYELSEGERVEDTPWQVLSIESDRVVMLYGDSQVVLRVGQGVTK